MSHSRPDIVPVVKKKKTEIPLEQASQSLILKAWKSYKSITNTKSLHSNNWTSWSRILRQKLIVAQISTFYGTRMFITVFTKARRCTLFWARWIQSSPSNTLSLLTLSPTLRLGLPRCLLIPGFPIRNMHAYPIFPICATCFANLILLYLITKIIV
jgi:hypothetical protein